jgi:hypothetical protein
MQQVVNHEGVVSQRRLVWRDGIRPENHFVAYTWGIGVGVKFGYVFFVDDESKCVSHGGFSFGCE